MVEKALVIICYLVLTALGVLLMWRSRVASPIFWYPLSLALIAVGVFAQIDFSHRSDVDHIAASFVAIICFYISSVTLYVGLKIPSKISEFKRKRLQNDTAEVWFLVWIIFAVSVGVTVFYYYNVGLNMLVLILTSSVSDDFSTLRLSMYAGDQYYAAGYVNQFKNFLLPLTAAAIGYKVWTKYSFVVRIIYILVVVPFILFALLGTGQRTYLVYAFVATLFGFLLVFHGSQVKVYNWKTQISVLLLVLTYVGMTASYHGTDGGVLEVVNRAFTRIFYSQQWGGLEAFRYIADQPVVWFTEWGESLLGILPGHKGSTLANEVHDVMFQSFRGTAPPTVVGSAYHNGRYIAVVLFFLVVGASYTLIYYRFISGSKTVMRCLAYGALFFYLVTYFAGSPKYIFDNGVIAIVIFLFLRKLRLRSSISSHNIASRQSRHDITISSMSSSEQYA